jgi:predicted acylesterase/phospholipase RssA
VIERIRRLWRRPSPPKRALALSGGGVVGGMYEVGVLAALEERLGAAWDWDIYVGCSAGSVVASVLANGVRPSELYRILDQDLPDPLNFRRSSVYARDSFRRAFLQFARFVWAVGKNAVTGARGSIPDMLARAERDFPAGFFSLAQLERYMREALEARGLTNSFEDLKRVLLIPAVDLDRAERVVFGRGELAPVLISQAVAASSAIPGFFEPFAINGRDYVDGGVGWSGHADVAADTGADVVVVVNPLVPAIQAPSDGSIRQRGMYFIMEQSNRIYNRNLLQQNLAATGARYPKTAFFLIQPAASGTPLFGPSMGFDASRSALRYGYASTRDWLAGRGADLARRLTLAAVATTA